MIAIDDSDLPVVVVQMTGASSDAEVRATLEALEALLAAQDGPYALLIDAREAALPTSDQLEMVAASLRANEAQALMKVVGMAFVTENPATVAAVHALFELAPTAIPRTIEERLSRARAWTRSRISETQV